ncbi:MAG: AMP-dependent synthetase, partial [Acidimicrobiia bacterium]|nr:AMP-dependent synthetase [Acidimicrobiia bacterium]
LVITGGVNVRPQEVERALLEVPGVEDAAVFGAPDERWGERLCAAVVVDGVDEAALRAFTAGRLAPTKRPKDFFVVADLPRTANGKVRRRDLPGWCRA